MPSIYIKTLGCKVNTYDTHALQSQFTDLGYNLLPSSAGADVTILNTCSVTTKADREGRYLLRRFRRENPDAIVVATGCYAQTDSEALAAMPEVDYVIPNQIKEKLAELIDQRLKARNAGHTATSAKIPLDLKPVSKNRQGHFKTALGFIKADPTQTRAFLKIQDGCNGFCSYCLIPYARGASRSVAPDAVLREVRRLIASGIKEIVFTGIHIGDYGTEGGTEPGEKPFTALIRTLFAWPDMVRLRISSLEPGELDENLLKLLATRPEIFCDHFHLPLQSGCDRILKLMRRTYDSKAYADKLAMIRAYFPRANLGADVIPGFPGETEEEAAATCQFIEDVGLNYLHAFPYSRRPNTAADRMPGHLPAATIKDRTKTLQRLGEQLKQTYETKFIGENAEVLWEETMDPAQRRLGKTKNYLTVAAAGQSQPQAGCLNEVVLKGFTGSGHFLGRILAPH